MGDVRQIIASLDQLNREEIEEILVAARERLETMSEDDWEASRVETALGDALLPDGQLDFAKLRARGKIITLEELFPEGDSTDES
ncbi:MAG: hypothetical protein BroJett018_51220 [Chloroflexota bacterium]|nr:MAG: hypothetical protein BroJett018_51220 [Chloroflexota bacterium]